VLHKLRFPQRLFAKRSSSDRAAGKRSKGAIFVEYLLLVTLVGLGVIVGLAALRTALVNELMDLANAINAINT
jgi:pilus assembly protein Flp/PilA